MNYQKLTNQFEPLWLRPEYDSQSAKSTLRVSTHHAHSAVVFARDLHGRVSPPHVGRYECLLIVLQRMRKHCLNPSLPVRAAQTNAQLELPLLACRCRLGFGSGTTDGATSTLTLSVMPL